MNNGNKPIEIYLEPDSFILKRENYLIQVDKKTHDNSNLEKYEPKTNAIYCYGIVGCLEAKNQKYLIYIDEVEKKGVFLESDIYLITKFNYIPYQGNGISAEDFNYVSMINDFLGRNMLYFSERFDLTISFNYLKNVLDNYKDLTWTNIFSHSNKNYCWNSFLANSFVRETADDLDKFIFPIINGFFGICKGEEYNKELTLALIARKDIRRSGMRFLIRGADKEGNVANSVEIEQILVHDNGKNAIINSYVQLRGSIPFQWTQEPNMTRNPKVAIQGNQDENFKVFSIHINELINKYNSVHCINLIDKKKDQKKVGDEFERLCNEFKSKEAKNGKNLEFSWFDFHHECKKMRYGNIKKLFMTENVSKNLEQSKYTSVEIDQNKFQDMLKDKKSKILEYLIQINFLKYIENQKVVFRTNCMDSLDRTNVVQSVFARYFLLLMLKDLGLSDVSPSKENISIEFKGNFESKFKNLWADNGDNLAFTYSGTGAMKSDFVRTGKRSVMGALRDGYLTMKRLYINNLMDGYNQDCHDYFLGNLNIKKDKLKSHSLLGVLVLHFISILLWFMMTKKVKTIEFGYFYPLVNCGVWLVLTVVIIYVTAMLLKSSFLDFHSKHK